MASTVIDLSLRVMVFTLAIAIATLPTSAEQKEKLIAKTTVTLRAYNESQEVTYSRSKVDVTNHNAEKPFSDEMEAVTSESTSTAAHCSAKETASVDLGALLDAGEGAMVTLVARETRLMAHRAVLTARSPVFAAMLCPSTQEASSGEVAIPDVEGTVLRHLVAYLYTLRTPQLPGMASQLLAAADKFGLSALKAECEVQLATQLTVENAAATAVLAVRHSSTNLRQAVIAFIRAHWVQVFTTKGWADAVRYQPRDVNEVYRLIDERPADTSSHNGSLDSTQAAPDSQPTTEAPTLPYSSQGQTPTPDDDTISRLRSLPPHEKALRLMEAAEVGRLKEVEALLAAGTDVNARDGGMMTALHWAAQTGHLEVARYLIGAGAQMDAQDRRQHTPLHWAAANGHAAMVQLLAASSSDPNAMDKWGRTPLHVAVFNGDAVAAAALLEAGSKRGARDDWGITPQDIARHKGKQQLIRLLA